MAGESGFNKILETLQNVDFADLDMEDVGRWPLAIRIFATILVLLFTLGLGYYFVVSNKYETLKTEEALTLSLKSKYEVAARNAANLEEYKKQMERIEHEFSVLVSQLPNDTEVPGLLDDITDEGVGNGLDFSSIGLNPEQAADIYVELPIQINVRGGYHNIASFISGIASLPRIVTVHNFSIKPESPGSTILVMDLLAKTYRYNDAKDTNTVATLTTAIQ